jgi:hypothetical protein
MNMRRAREYNTPGNAGSRIYPYRVCFGQSPDELPDVAERPILIWAVKLRAAMSGMT